MDAPLLSTNEALGVLVVTGKLNYVTYKLLAEWLECYEYIIPADRKLVPRIVTHITPVRVTTPSELFTTWLISDILYSCFTYTEQLRILSWLGHKNG